VDHPSPKTLLRYVFERPLLKTGGEVMQAVIELFIAPETVAKSARRFVNRGAGR